eukprot:4607822-Pyramimonas_sp.AAC.1
MGDGLLYTDLGTGALVMSLTCGKSHTCARLSNGQAKCWGENREGQLGLGTSENMGDGSGEMGGLLPVVGTSGDNEDLVKPACHSRISNSHAKFFPPAVGVSAVHRDLV